MVRSRREGEAAESRWGWKEGGGADVEVEGWMDGRREGGLEAGRLMGGEEDGTSICKTLGQVQGSADADNTTCTPTVMTWPALMCGHVST